jgi:uncharacterized RDD family membrane protein YckC
LAGPLPRAYARVVDLLVQLAILMIVGLLIGSLGGFGAAVIMITWFVILWLFPAWCESRWGATPGKRVVGLMVVRDDGRPAGWGPALTRNLLWIIDFLPALFAVGLLTMLLSRDFKRLGDLAAGTIVVYGDARPRMPQIPAADARAPDRPLTVAEQRTVLDFAERVQSFTQDRASELAELPTPLLGGSRGHFATQRLLQIANYLVGRGTRTRA